MLEYFFLWGKHFPLERGFKSFFFQRRDFGIFFTGEWPLIFSILGKVLQNVSFTHTTEEEKDISVKYIRCPLYLPLPQLHHPHVHKIGSLPYSILVINPFNRYCCIISNKQIYEEYTEHGLNGNFHEYFEVNLQLYLKQMD